jgi:hypothetical protein
VDAARPSADGEGRQHALHLAVDHAERPVSLVAHPHQLARRHARRLHLRARGAELRGIGRRCRRGGIDAGHSEARQQRVDLGAPALDHGVEFGAQRIVVAAHAERDVEDEGQEGQIHLRRHGREP